MSQETMQWLNRNVLIGLTNKRGNAWHYRASDQGDEPNHYPGFIPVPDVERRLFGFDPIEAAAGFLKPLPTDMVVTSQNRQDTWVKVGDEWFDVKVDAEHKAIVDPDNDIAFDYPTPDYQIHNYRQWLIKNVATILDADLGISSAGLLRRRAQAWVEVSIPENVVTPEGVTFRPNLLVFTSLDRTLATTYKRTINFVVCDNTLRARIGEAGEMWRIKHTANSIDRIGEARQALNIIYSAADEFAEELSKLCNVPVTEAQWQKVLDSLSPTKDKEGRGLTIATNKREKLDDMYHSDPRCAPWRGTKFGVIQTANTFNLHEATVRNTHGGGRPERIQLKVISGQAEAVDAYASELVDAVLANA